MNLPPVQPPLYVARVETSAAVADFVEEAAVLDADDHCTVWIDADRDFARIEYFCATEAEARHRLQALEPLVRPRFPAAPWSAATDLLPYENWAETWKRFFHPEKVSPRLWIKPSWEPCNPAPGEFAIEIDPGMSFGTGQHGTTRGCLVFLDAIAQTRAGLGLLDVGCGSGILAIAAARLGYARILAVDNDPDAIRIAAGNAAMNGVAGHIAFRVADLSSAAQADTREVVVANILATVLTAHASILSSLVAPGPDSALILSGILNPQARGVQDAFEDHGFELHDTLELGEWTTLWMKPRSR